MYTLSMLRRRGSKGCCLACFALVSATGCASTEPKEIREDTIAFEEYPQITPLENLHRRVLLSKVVEDKGPPMTVTVVVRHDDSSDVRHVQYRFLFLDKDELPENADPDWHYAQLEPRTLAYLKGNALSRNASAWRLEIRPAH
jgi:uncharacterized protein YcfL